MFENPLPEDDDNDGYKREFHWAIPKISNSEKYFVSQLISSPTKEVLYLLLFRLLIKYTKRVNFILNLIHF